MVTANALLRYKFGQSNVICKQAVALNPARKDQKMHFIPAITLQNKTMQTIASHNIMSPANRNRNNWREMNARLRYMLLWLPGSEGTGSIHIYEHPSKQHIWFPTQ